MPQPKHYPRSHPDGWDPVGRPLNQEEEDGPSFRDLMNLATIEGLQENGSSPSATRPSNTSQESHILVRSNSPSCAPTPPGAELKVAPTPEVQPEEAKTIFDEDPAEVMKRLMVAFQQSRKST